MLALSYDHFGLTGNSSQTSRDNFQKAREILEKLVVSDPQNANAHKNNLAVVIGNLGGVDHGLGNNAAACKLFQDSCNISLELSQVDPIDINYKLNIGYSYCALAGVNLDLGDLSAARQAAKNALELSQKLAREDPTGYDAQNLLVDSYECLGNVNVKSGDVAAARGAIQRRWNFARGGRAMNRPEVFN